MNTPMRFSDRDFPGYMIGGLCLTGAGIVTAVSSWTNMPMGLVVTAAGAWLLVRGWIVSGERGRRR